MRTDFTRRTNNIRMRDERLKNSNATVTYKLREDGLMVAVTASAGKSRFPFALMIFISLTLLAAKVGAHMYFGSEQVSEYAVSLAEKSPMLRVVEVMLQREPLTDWLVGQGEELIRTHLN